MPSSPDNPAAKRIVALVMKRLEITSAAELAKALDMPPYSEGAVSLVRRWLRGAHGPSFDYTMAMLSKAGLLTAEADRAWLGQSPDAREQVRAAAAAADEAKDALGQPPDLAERAQRGSGTK